MLPSMSNHYQTRAPRRQNGAGWTLTIGVRRARFRRARAGDDEVEALQALMERATLGSSTTYKALADRIGIVPPQTELAPVV